MVIGIEASSLCGPRSGVGYYTKYLTQAIARLSSSGQTDLRERVVLLSHRGLNGEAELPGAELLQFPAKAFWFQFRLPALAGRMDLDLVHFPNYVVPLRWRRHCVVTIHDLSLLRHPEWHPPRRRLIHGNRLAESARKARFILCVSESVKQDIIERLGIEPARIRVTPLAPADHFRRVPEDAVTAVRRKYALPSEYILYVGNIEPRKNLPRLISVWEATCANGSQGLPLVLVGRPAWLCRETLQACRKSIHSQQIYMTGYVSETDLPALYCGARAFVYPSVFEGFGLPVLEAMACGVPVLTSDIPSIRETAGDAALLFNPTDRDALAAGLRRIIEDDEVRDRLRTQGLAVVSRYSWEKTAQATLAAYREAVPEANRASNVAAALRAAQGRSQTGRYIETLPHVLSPEEFSILQTLLYSSLFEYPLTPGEVRTNLLRSVQTEQSIVHCYYESQALQKLFDFQEGYFFLRGQERLVEVRRRREALSREVLQRNRRILWLLCAVPYTRLVALSGSAAHLNMEGDADIDLLVVTRGSKVWSVAVAMLFLTKLLGRRKMVCFNFILSDRHLKIEPQDLFSANQMTHLVPLIGDNMYRRFVEENPFVLHFYPNFHSSQVSFDRPILGPAGRVFKRALELLLSAGISQLHEWVSRKSYGTYLRRKSRFWTSPQEVVLAPDYLKLHTQSHRHHVMHRFQRLVEQTLASLKGQ